MAKGTNCKEWTIDKANEIKEICTDLKYSSNKQLKIKGLELIDYLASRILEHLEYLDIKESEDKR